MINLRKKKEEIKKLPFLNFFYFYIIKKEHSRKGF